MIDEIIEQLKPLINGKLIYLSQYGSHLYGLNTENSDLDFRGIYIPTLDDIILHKDKDEINDEMVFEEIKYIPARNITDSYGIVHCLKESKETKRIKVDVKIFSLQKFIQLCSKADTNALDLLFSIENNFIEKYIVSKRNVTDSVIWKLYSNRSKLISTDRLESPITYAFKQAEKYSIKGTRLTKIKEVLTSAKEFFNIYNNRDILNKYAKDKTVEDLVPHLQNVIDNKHVKIDELDNRGKLEKYLYVGGVQHQFNLELSAFIKRLEDKIKKEYTSQRTIDASDGNDWKALSHAIRVLLEIKELLDTGTIQFPLKDKEFLLYIKLGKVDRELIDIFFNQELSNILERIQKNGLAWKYNEKFWNKFIIKEVKNGKL